MLEFAGVTPETRVPLNVLGPISLRTTLELLLGQLGLAARALADVLDQISREINEAIVLDPTQCRAGTIDPKNPVTIEREDVPLGEALKQMLAPLGLEAVIHDDVILVRKQA